MNTENDFTEASASVPASPRRPPASSRHAERWWVVPGLSFFALSMFALTVVYVFVLRDKDYIMLMLGAVIGMVNQGPWGFYFGTSRSSQEKDQTIATKLNPPAAS